MNVLIIPDKFKGSLTAEQVAEAIETGLRERFPSLHCQRVVASDGGDGFLESVRQNNPAAELVSCVTVDPLGRPFRAEYLVDRQSKTAYVEMAKASGMELLKPEERNPLHTTTYGTGVFIRDAINNGAKRVYVGLGGSATNDGGVGIAMAMGLDFRDARGRMADPIGESLANIESIDRGSSAELLADTQIFAINDVTNPLLGDEGAAAVYAPQKGADAEMVATLESGLGHLSEIVRRDLESDAANEPGAGAAGGTGYGLRVFLGAEFLSGIDFILSLAGVEQLVSAGDIDWIITGEGKIDDQTAYGKLVRGVATVGQNHGVPVAAICGLLALENKTVDDIGLDRVKAIHEPPRPVEYTINHAGELVIEAAKELLD